MVATSEKIAAHGTGVEGDGDNQDEAAQAFLDSHKSYLEETVNPILDELVLQVLQERPTDPVPFLIKSLTDQLKERTVTDPIELMMLERCATELKHFVKELKANGGVMPPAINEDDFDEDIEDDHQMFSMDPIAMLRKQLTAQAARKGDVEHHDNDVDDDDDTDDTETDDSDDTDEDDEVASLDYEPPPHLLKRPRHSVSAEAYGEFNQRRAFTPPHHLKPFEEREKISSVIENLFLFQALDGKDINAVINAMIEVRLTETTRIIQQGDDGDALYIVGEGVLNCFKIFNYHPSLPHDELDPEKNVKVCGPGDLFGELALLYNCPRAASVESEGPALLWKLDRETFTHIVKDAASKKREMYEQFLSSAPLLKELDPYERSKIADALKTQTFADGKNIVTQGDSGDTFYFIEEGRASAIKSFTDGSVPIEVMRYDAGDYFGELAILRNAPRAASVIAKGPVRVAFLNRQAFKRLLGPIEPILERNASKYAGRAESVIFRSETIPVGAVSKPPNTTMREGEDHPVLVEGGHGAKAVEMARQSSLAGSASRGPAPNPTS